MKQEPITLEGIEGIEVEMLNYPESPEKIHELIYEMTMETFLPGQKGYIEKTPENIRKVVKDVMEGNTLRNALEAIKFTFRIKNVSRTMTHQWVRTRIGAGYTQLSERANDVRELPVRIPYPIAKNEKLKKKWENKIAEIRELYIESLEEGIHPQDARFIMPQGTISHVDTTMTLNTIENVIHRRGCSNMQWEIHYAAIQIAKWLQDWDELIGQYMKPLCEKLGKCTWVNYDFPPCDKQPLPDDYKVPEDGYLRGMEVNGSLEFENFKPVMNKDGDKID